METKIPRPMRRREAESCSLVEELNSISYLAPERVGRASANWTMCRASSGAASGPSPGLGDARFRLRRSARTDMQNGAMMLAHARDAIRRIAARVAQVPFYSVFERSGYRFA